MQMPFFQNPSSFHFHPDQKADTKIPAFYLKQKALVPQEVLVLAVSLIPTRFLTLARFPTQILIRILTLTRFPSLIHFLAQSLMAFQIHFLFQSLALIRIL